MVSLVDVAFCKRLPKAELHAHLSGSISRDFLHEQWKERRATGRCLDLPDPLLTIRPEGMHHDISTFFKLFSGYIYSLVDDCESVRKATRHVLQAFQDDGVAYLELRTTPRTSEHMTASAYIAAVHHSIKEFHGDVHVKLILSIDRSMTVEQASETVDLAIKFQDTKSPLGLVVGVDLCGSPATGDVSIYQAAFSKAKSSALKITLHFAEIPKSSTDAELETLLSFEPDRLGHVINVSQSIKAVIEQQRPGLELCMSCNVLAKLTDEDFAKHHFGTWRKTACPIALSTDDVGIFDSPLSNEYLLASQHFHLNTKNIIELSRQAIICIFGNDSEKERMRELLQNFESQETAQSGLLNDKSAALD